MNLHDEIMRIPCDPKRSPCRGVSAELAYKSGHRDARHAAAELAAAAEQPVAQERTVLGWRDMGSAPKDGTMIRLLVEFEDNATEDDGGPSITIGFNSLGNDQIDKWNFAGWCWTHDRFTGGIGTPIRWLPLADGTEQPDAVLSMLGEDDMYWLRRFRDCREDDEDEHDLPEAAILSLETLGALRSIGHEQHEITKFGDYLLGKESV